MNDAVERAIRLLEEERFPSTPEGIEEALGKRGLEVEGDPRAFAESVLREGARRTARVLEGLWEALGVPPPPEVEETLRKGHRVEVHYPWPAGADSEGEKVLVWLGGKDQGFHFPLPCHVRSEALSLKASAWGARVRVGPGLFARKEGASLLAQSLWEVERALEETQALRPLFAALGLGDLEGALEALLGLEDGEARSGALTCWPERKRPGSSGGARPSRTRPWTGPSSWAARWRSSSPKG